MRSSSDGDFPGKEGHHLSGLNSPGSGLVASIDEKGLVIDHISMNTQSV